MLLLDRYILARFFANFIILFMLLFVFAATIDLILNLDRFVDAARDRIDAETARSMSLMLIALIADFELPRIFQFYAFLHGLIAVGAMAFTLAQMHRHRELVAVMSSGTSLYRVAMPFIFAVFVLSVLQLANQELMLPRVAPLLLRSHAQIGQNTVNEFEIRLTPDSRGNILQSPSFDPARSQLDRPTFLERSDRGLTTRRITADRAVWDGSEGAWRLINGRAVSLSDDPDDITNPPPEAVELYPTDLSPRVLTVRRHNEYAAMLSLVQIAEMLDSGGGSDQRGLLRYRYARFATVLVNLLVLGLTLPFFLLREPANLMRQALICAGLSVPAMLGAGIGMIADLPGIPPAASVFLPVLILLFVAVVPWSFFKT